jgi:TrmH family RNA methyltransferase
VRRLRRLIQKRSLRWSEGVCVLEGADLIAAALDGDVEFEALYVDGEHVDSPDVAALVGRAQAKGVRVFALAGGVLEKVADATTPQPLLAAVRFPISQLTAIACEGLILVLHDVRDPGNAGTIIRSSDAAGVTAVIFTGQSVDPFNPKTLRATAGSIFHVPVVVSTLEETLQHFVALGARTYATLVRGGEDHRSVDFSTPSVVVIGNEANGLDDAAASACQGAVSIAMAGRNESLNAGAAAALIVFEALWQRQGADTPRPPSSLTGT